MEGNNKKSHTIIPDDNDRNHSYKTTKNSPVSEDSSTKRRTKGIPTVTQATQQEDDDSSVEVESPKQDSTSFDAVNKPFRAWMLSNKKARQAESTKVQNSKRCKQGVWYYKFAGSTNRIPVEKKENNKRRSRRLKARTIKNLEVGSLVKKELWVDVDNKSVLATVFGSIQSLSKGGKWLVHFENGRYYHLKASEFEFVSSNKNQSVLSADRNNEMTIESPKKHHLVTQKKQVSSATRSLDSNINKEEQPNEHDDSSSTK